MAQQPLPDIKQDIIRILHQRGKDYLTVRQIVASLSTRVRQQLSLTTRHTTADLLKKITPLLDERLQVYHGPTSTYIGQKRSPAALILHRVQQRPGISPKQLGMSLPLSKRNYLTALNTLLSTGMVICTFKDNHMPMLHLSSNTLAKDTTQASGEDDRSALHAAYHTIGQGRSFVRISLPRREPGQTVPIALSHHPVHICYHPTASHTAAEHCLSGYLWALCACFIAVCGARAEDSGYALVDGTSPG